MCLSPIAESVERNTITNVLLNADIQTRQSFMYTFWARRSPENPEAAWRNYYADVLAVQQEFGTKIKAGWQTDRGRVYLQYGKPNTRIVKNNDPDYWPFEIWHYYTTNTGMRDRRFLFYNTSLTSDKELLHSDIPSEVQNYDWKNLVRSRRMNDPTSVGRNSTNQNSDPYSRDELEDLWYNPH
jgi:GWxTD domain-containing protein